MFSENTPEWTVKMNVKMGPVADFSLLLASQTGCYANKTEWLVFNSITASFVEMPIDDWLNLNILLGMITNQEMQYIYIRGCLIENF